MRIAIAGFLICICSNLLHGQKDKVFLKNGSLIRGTVSDGVILDTLSIEIDKSTITLPLSLVDEVRFRRRNGERPTRYRDFAYPAGWFTTVEGGVYLGSHSQNDHLRLRPAVKLTQEYHFSPLLNGGIGIGMVSYEDYNIFPLTLDYYALMGGGASSWLLFGSVGHGFADETTKDTNGYEVSSGLHYQAGLGWQRQLGKNAIRLKAGYAVQAVEEKRELWENYTEIRTRRINRVIIQVAYVLKY